MKSTRAARSRSAPVRWGRRRAVPGPATAAVSYELVVVVVAVVVVVDLGLAREEYVARRAVEADAARVDDDDAGQQPSSAPSSWVTIEHRDAALDEPVEHVGEDVLVGGVDPGGRLVHDEHVGLAGEGAGDEHPALLAAREGADLGRGAVGEADDVERAGDDLPVGGAQPSEPADAATAVRWRRSPRRWPGRTPRGCAAAGRSRGGRRSWNSVGGVAEERDGAARPAR